MKAPCKKCGKMFERATKFCMICDDCWTQSRKDSQRKPFHALKTCPICCEHIQTKDSRIHIQKRDRSRKLYGEGNSSKSLGMYHTSCWEKYILPKIEKLLTKDKVQSWINNLKPLECTS